MGLIAPQQVESSLTMDRTRVPSIGRQILTYWTTKEVLEAFFVWIMHLYLIVFPCSILGCFCSVLLCQGYLLRCLPYLPMPVKKYSLLKIQAKEEWANSSALP